MRRVRKIEDVSELAWRFADYELVVMSNGKTRRRKAPFDPNVKVGQFTLTIKPKRIRRRRKPAL